MKKYFVCVWALVVGSVLAVAGVAVAGPGTDGTLASEVGVVGEAVAGEAVASVAAANQLGACEQQFLGVAQQVSPYIKALLCEAMQAPVDTDLGDGDQKLSPQKQLPPKQRPKKQQPKSQPPALQPPVVQRPVASPNFGLQSISYESAYTYGEGGSLFLRWKGASASGYQYK